MNISRASLLLRLIFAFLVALSPLAIASDTDSWGLGPIGGVFRTVPGTSQLRVESVTAGAPGAAAGLLAGDVIYGAFGQEFGALVEGYKGSVQGLGEAIERAEAGNGSLPLLVLRPGTGGMTINVALPASGAFGPAYPRGSAKFDAMYQWAAADIHTRTQASSNGDFGYNTGWFGFVLLSHPNWADTSGAKPYRNSINKLRARTVTFLDSRVLAPVKSAEPGFVDPGLENWDIGSSTMFLAEYVNKTGDTSVMASLQRACDALANRIQLTGEFPGHMGHGGVEGDYGNWALNIINVHTHAAFAMAKRAGATINQSKWDLSWNNCLKGATARSDGHAEDGYVDYGPAAWGQGSGWDASGRTSGSIFGFYNYGQNPTADDTDALNRMKGYVVRQWPRMQICHAYTLGGVAFYQLALPYLPDRDQRFLMENLRFFYQFHRQPNGTLKYFGGRGNNGGDDYCGFDNVKIINVAMAQAVANGGLPSMPAANPERIYANMKSPWVSWPTPTAKYAALTGLAQNLTVDIADFNGAVLQPADYTAAWTQVSGPGNAVFANPSSATTNVNFPTGGRYRLQLSVTRGSYVLTELYDFDVAEAAPPAGYVMGKVNYEAYTAISGNSVANLTSASKFPALPDVVGTLSSLDATYRGDNYGQRIRGFIVPPTTGNYRFYISSDDASQLKLNSAGASEAGATVVCSMNTSTTQYNWTKEANQQSAQFNLIAGQPYFFEILHKEGGGSDHVAVGWTGPGFGSVTVIPGTSIAMDSSVTILKQPISRTVAPGGTANFTVAVKGAGPFNYQWRLNGVAYWGVSSSPTLSLPNASAGLAGTYDCVITSPAGTMTSASAYLTVASTPTITQGGLRREVWNTLSGTSVANLTGFADYPTFPDATSSVTSVETPQGYGDNYGQRLTGWLVPPTTGQYKFYLASDDASELWLSTNSTSGNKVKIAQITGYSGYRSYSSGGQSALINLTAGQRYFIEVLHKEGGGGDHLSVAWQTPGGSAPANGSAPIDGAFLEYIEDVPDPEYNGLVSWWRMDEGAGSVAYDTAGVGADGVGNAPAWGAGRRLGGLVFDGNDKVDCGINASLSGLTPFSVTAWVKVNAGTTTEGVIAAQRGPGGGWNGAYIFKVDGAGKISFWLYGDSNEQFNLVGTTSINDGVWHHVAASRDDSGNASIYLDGVLNGSVAGTTVRNLSSSAPLGIGGDLRDNNKFFRGGLDDIRLYNRALSTAEIADIRNRAPVFAADPVAANATKDVPFNSTLIASDPDLGETLTYSKVSGPAWLAVAANGTLSGTPNNTNLGLNQFVVRVTDSFGMTDDAALNITVANSTNNAPTFSANPFSKPNASEDSAYSNTIAGSATDVDSGDTLTYSKVSGPAWLSVAANGALSGTPANSDVGANSFTVRVTDAAGAIATATLNITAVNVNDAPTFTANPIGRSNAAENSAYSDTIAGSATDVDAGDTLTYSKVNGPAWLSVAANGALSGIPSISDVGANSFTVRVSDAAGTNATATLNITVSNVNDAPTFASSSISLADATTGTAYSGTISGSATDPDAGDTLTYSKTSGPAWLTVASSGTLGGTPSGSDAGTNNFTVRVTDAGGLFNEATLTINVVSVVADGTWVSSAGGSWPVASNWIGSTVAGGAGKTADFSTLNLTSDVNVTLDGAVTLGHLAFGDTAASNNWSLAPGAGGSLTLDAVAGIPTIAVNNQSATISAVIAGTDGLAKTGAGKLVLTGTNTYTGGNTVAAGTLQLGDGVINGSVNGGYQISSGATLRLARTAKTTVTNNALTGAGTVNLFVAGTSNGGGNFQWDTFSVLDSNFTGKIAVEEGRISYTLANLGATSAIEIQPGAQFLAWGTGTPTYPQSISIAGLGWGESSFQFGGLRMAGNSGTATWAGPVTLTANSGILVQPSSNFNITGHISGSYECLFYASDNSTLNIAPSGALQNSYSGTRVKGQANGPVVAGNAYAFSTGGLAVDGAILKLNGYSFAFANLTGTGGKIGNYATAASTLTVGGDNTNTTNATQIIDGGTGTLAFTKVGTGTLTLTGASTYTGATSVNGGSLIVNGSLGATSVAVADGATLGGFGAINGAVAVQSGGTLSPGEAAIGTLTVNNTVALGGNTAMQISRSGAVLTADRITGVSTLTYGGTLDVTDAGPDALVVGDTFQLFSATNYSGGFVGYNLPSLAAGLVWDTTQLGVNGTITVGSIPVAVNDSSIMAEDAVGDFAVLANDTDADGDTLNIQSCTQGAHGSVSASGNNIIYTPAANWSGTDSFTYTITDNQDGTSTATVNVTVSPVNDVPTFAANPIAGGNATEDAAYSGTLGGSASDVDAGDTLTYSKVSGPGWLGVAANGALSGTPGNSNVGANSFTVRVTDSTGATGSATLNITVINVNDAPTWASASIAKANATEDTAYSGSLAGDASDVDVSDTLTFSKVSGPAWLSVASNGALSGTPTNSEVGANTFTVRVADGSGAFANATLNINVGIVNDAPVFTVDPILKADGSVGTAYTGQTLAGSATDVDAGATLTYSKVSGPAWLSVASSGALSGTPPSGSTGLNTFIVRVTDNASATDDAELRINVLGLPLPWTNGDIGTGMLAGSTTHSSGTFTEAGSGALGGASDKLQFAYQTLSGDGEIIARISALQNTGTSSRVGVMIRDTLATNSKQIFMGLTSSGSYRWVRRTTTGGTNSSNNSSSGTVPNTWVRLTRVGNTITAYKSSNGSSWTTVGSTTVTMATNCYIGLAVSSGSNTTLNTSQFTSVSVTP